MPVRSFVFLAFALAALPACRSRFKLPAEARFASQVAVGDGFACTTMKDASARCWGTNDTGQLGDGTLSSKNDAVAVDTSASRIHSVAAGARHACAATDAGVWCWGANDAGQLGDGTRVTQAKAVRVPSVSAVDLALGTHHSCARGATGEVTCWGANDAGQLGSVGSDAAPRAVPGVKARVIAAGGDATCAIGLDDSIVQCWGRVPGTPANSPTGVARVEGLVAARSIAVGPTHACATLEDGSVACWGSNDQGELGDGTFTDRPKATHIPGLTGAIRVAVGRHHTCTLMHDATIFCWGANDSSQLADGTNAHRAAPILISGVMEVADIAAGGDATCARYGNGIERCWGALLLPKTDVLRITVPMDVRW